MPDGPGLVHVVDDVPELADPTVRPVLVHALDGFLDAGNAGHLVADELGRRLGSRVVASFAVDELYDYRGRRPALSFLEDRYADYDAPRLVLRLVRDDAEVPFLLLAGPEPDYRWEAFALAVRSLVQRFGVSLVLGLGAVPMAVPHTRPLMLTRHATTPELRREPNVWKGRLRVPASAHAVLELRLGEWGHPAMGFVAHVPHYVAQLDYPAAAVALLAAVSRQTGLRVDTAALAAAAQVRMAEIATQVEASAEIAEAVAALESQYDAFARAAEAPLPAGDDAGAGGAPLPSAEELGAAFERFLAGLDRRDEES
ncbi:MAG: PAC2 family protein [Actinomycetota bacterium]|nr:PAC2 family protein [Actinomycetota bacterium]